MNKQVSADNWVRFGKMLGAVQGDPQADLTLEDRSVLRKVARRLADQEPRDRCPSCVGMVCEMVSLLLRQYAPQDGSKKKRGRPRKDASK